MGRSPMGASVTYLLAADVGGTKTELGIFSTEKGLKAPLLVEEYPSRDFESFEALLRRFLGRVDMPVRRACFCAAGPVREGELRTTNLPWVIAAEPLAAAFSFEKVSVLNDLQATAYAVNFLGASDLVTLASGKPVSGGAIGVIAPGTGLGEAFLVWTGSDYLACPSEGGHCDFAPQDETQAGLLRYLQRRLDHVSYERVCSGIGIPDIYDFLVETTAGDETAAVVEQLAAAPDRTRLIVDLAVDPAAPSALCRQAVDVFVRVLGAEAGNLALKVLATGGVYLAGGLPVPLLPLLQQPPFLDAFRAKGRFSGFMEAIPVHVITRQVALLGAAAYGMDLAARGR
jgi:glucokinase